MTKKKATATAVDVFYLLDGTECTLDRLCREEPAWAANRIRDEIARAEKAEAEVERLRWSVTTAEALRTAQENERLRGLVDEAYNYTDHQKKCLYDLHPPNPCDCGYADWLARAEDV